MRSRKVLAGLLLAPFAWTAAQAQEAAPPAPEAIPVDGEQQAAPAEAPKADVQTGSRIMGEIVVTAQKREENLQDVPIAISAFTAEQLDARGVTGIKDLGPSTPSLQFTDFVGYTLVYLRGIGTDTFIPSADPSVATYIDGVYFPGAHSLGQSFGALERIEVLKGPQGTLFGRNATGGAINVVTKRPGAEAETSVQTSYGRFDDLKTRVYTSVPLTDWLSASVSGFYNHGDSHYEQDNPNLPPDVPHDVAKGGRVKLGFYPTDNLKLVLTGLHTRQNGSTAPIGVNTAPTLLGTLSGIQPETRDYVTPNDDQPYVATRIQAYYGQGDLELPWFDVRAIGSNFHIKTFDYRVDFDGSAVPLVTSETPNEFQKLKSGELQLLSNEDTWGADWLKWIGGFYYFEATGGYNPVVLTVANTAVTLPTGELVQLIPQAILDLPAVGEILGNVPAPQQVQLFLDGAVGTKSYSGYLQATATLTDWVDLTLGGRYQREKRSLIKSNVDIANLAGDSTTLVPFAPQSSTSKNFSPRVSLDFHVIDDTLIYLSYSRAYKSATYNIVNAYLPPDYIEPEEVNAYELGAKSRLLGGALQVNAAVFQNRIKQLQASFVSLLAGGAVQFENAGSARIRGAELDVTWLPMPDANAGLVLTAGGSYLDAIYTDFDDASGFDEQTGLFSDGNDYTGNRIPRVPEWTGSGGLSQTINLSSGSIEVGADYAYNGGFYFLSQNGNSKEDAYGLLSARLSYLRAPWGMRLTVFGDNLTDEKYRVSQFFTDFGRLDSMARPRTYGVRLNWDF